MWMIICCDCWYMRLASIQIEYIYWSGAPNRRIIQDFYENSELWTHLQSWKFTRLLGSSMISIRVPKSIEPFVIRVESEKYHILEQDKQICISCRENFVFLAVRILYLLWSHPQRMLVLEEHRFVWEGPALSSMSIENERNIPPVGGLRLKSGFPQYMS